MGCFSFDVVEKDASDVVKDHVRLFIDIDKACLEGGLLVDLS